MASHILSPPPPSLPQACPWHGMRLSADSVAPFLPRGRAHAMGCGSALTQWHPFCPGGVPMAWDAAQR
eukprot:248898-Chlamydomonas_euryale.AAC.2